MEKFIPKAKLSKKAKRALNEEGRKTWGILNPVTRKTENKRVYNRKKLRTKDDDFKCGAFIFFSYYCKCLSFAKNRV